MDGQGGSLCIVFSFHFIFKNKSIVAAGLEPAGNETWEIRTWIRLFPLQNNFREASATKMGTGKEKGMDKPCDYMDKSFVRENTFYKVLKNSYLSKLVGG